MNVVDDAMTLSAAYTRSGGGTFVPANSGDVVVAVLTVPTGSPAPYSRRWLFGTGAVNGVLEQIIGNLGIPFDDCVPEPGAASLLAACGFAAASSRRQRTARPHQPYPPTSLPN